MPVLSSASPICFLYIFLSQSHASPILQHSNQARSAPNTSQSTATNLEGWVQQPNGRGTIDIIWACVFTTFLCSWSVLCLNIPAEGEGLWAMIRRKTYLAGLAILGPEVVFSIAIGEWQSAHRSVAEFKALGRLNWTITHAFFADMGGFLLQTTDHGTFPVNAKQLHYLVANEYVDYPRTRKQDIDDKNKVDGLGRFVSAFQTLWFLVNSIARVVQHLTITAFELTTLGFIVCTIGSLFCWAHKPSDVSSHGEVLVCKVSMREILTNANVVDDTQGLTPLDFVSRREWTWSKLWQHGVGILHLFGMRFGPRVRPINRVPNDTFPEVTGFPKIVLLFFTCAYAAILMGGWNLRFPTPVERLLWRIAIGVMLAAICVYWLVMDILLFQVIPAAKARYPKIADRILFLKRRSRDSSSLKWCQLTPIGGKMRSIGRWMRNNSANKDPRLEIPLKSVFAFYFLVFCYCSSRAYVVVADIIELRRLPADAYETVNWSLYIPHL